MLHTLKFPLMFAAVLLATICEAHALRLSAGEALTHQHMEALLDPILPSVEPNQRRRLEFTSPSLPLNNPNVTGSDIQLVAFDLDETSGRFSGRLRVNLESGSQGRVPLFGRVRNEVLLPTLTTPISKGQLLNPARIEMAWFEDYHLERDVVQDTSDILELEAARRIPAGKPIRNIDVRQPRLINRGDLVELVYQRGHFRSILWHVPKMPAA